MNTPPRNVRRLIQAILALLSMLVGGCAADVLITRGGEKYELHMKQPAKAADDSSTTQPVATTTTPQENR